MMNNHNFYTQNPDNDCSTVSNSSTVSANNSKCCGVKITLWFLVAAALDVFFWAFFISRGAEADLGKALKNGMLFEGDSEGKLSTVMVFGVLAVNFGGITNLISTSNLNPLTSEMIRSGSRKLT
jgi:hypothetical protein